MPYSTVALAEYYSLAHFCLTLVCYRGMQDQPSSGLTLVDAAFTAQMGSASTSHVGLHKYLIPNGTMLERGQSENETNVKTNQGVISKWFEVLVALRKAKPTSRVFTPLHLVSI